MLAAGRARIFLIKMIKNTLLILMDKLLVHLANFDFSLYFYSFDVKSVLFLRTLNHLMPLSQRCPYTKDSLVRWALTKIPEALNSTVVHDEDKTIHVVL